VSSLAAFTQTGHGDIETIKPFVGEYRLRVGEWRVRFSLDAARGELVVLHVLNRRDAYRDYAVQSHDLPRQLIGQRWLDLA